MLGDLKRNMIATANFIIDSAKRELEEQGHKASGSLEDSFEFKIVEDDDKVVLEIWANGYALELDRGIPADQISYTLDQLVDWIGHIKPEMSEVEAYRFAQNINVLHRTYGVPTPNSYSWSENGRRTGWIEFAIENKNNEIEAILDVIGSINQAINVVVDTAIAEAQNV